MIRCAIGKLLMAAGFGLLGSSCAIPESAPLPVIPFEHHSSLPAPVSNNAVAIHTRAGQVRLFSFLGLGQAKGWQDITRQAASYTAGQNAWQYLPAVPGEQGRLASVAVRVGDAIYLIGGYTVAKDGGELSTPEIYRVNALQPDRYDALSPMPVPVDDAVALVYRDRYIYLVSGWHDVGNVNLVQVFDTQQNRWAQATPFPGEPVFGHAGGMLDRRMVICDGVKIRYTSTDQPREFLPSGECWLGEVNEQDYRRIQWQPLPAHPGPARYRMAAAGDGRGKLVFVGGSTNPYNYDGIGYNGEPSEPARLIFSFDFASSLWRCDGVAQVATMDHRSLLFDGRDYYVVGGMLRNQQVSDRVYRFSLNDFSQDHLSQDDFSARDRPAVRCPD